jgi:hypothetical protein
MEGIKMKRKILIGVLVLALLATGFVGYQIFKPTKAYSVNSMIQTPLNTAVDNTTWTAITLGAAQRCSSFVAKIRGSNTWKMSDSSTGTKYITIASTNSIAMDITAAEGETLFYVQTATSADTLELLLTRD